MGERQWPWAEGLEAALRGEPCGSNPYGCMTLEAAAWDRGFVAAIDCMLMDCSEMGDLLPEGIEARPEPRQGDE